MWPRRPGDQHAPPGSDKKLRYAQGMDDFSTGGQLRRDEVLKKGVTEAPPGKCMEVLRKFY